MARLINAVREWESATRVREAGSVPNAGLVSGTRGGRLSSPYRSVRSGASPRQQLQVVGNQRCACLELDCRRISSPRGKDNFKNDLWAAYSTLS